MSQTLRIAIDASFLASPHSGIGRFTSIIMRELAEQDLPHQVFLYSDKPFQLPFPLPERWRIRTASPRMVRFLQLRVSRILYLRALFEQLAFPTWARKDKVDVFWSASNHLPVLLPSRIRVYLVLHDVVYKRLPHTVPQRYRAIEAMLTPLSLRRAHRVLANSEFTRSEILHFFPQVKGKVDVVYHASNLKYMGPTGERVFDFPYFLFVGSREPRKNLKRLLEAYIKYRNLTVSPVDLVLAGTYGWGGFSVADFIREHDLQACVHMVDKADDSVVRALYANAFAVVMVSIYEGFGLPLVEAMQWGVPMVASRGSSVGEVAGDAALKVDPYDIDAIAEALMKLTEEPELRADLGEKSKARESTFSAKKLGTEMVKIIISDLHT